MRLNAIIVLVSIACLGFLWLPRHYHELRGAEMWEGTRHGVFGYLPTTEECHGRFGSWLITPGKPVKIDWPPPKEIPHSNGLLLTLFVTTLILLLDTTYFLTFSQPMAKHEIAAVLPSTPVPPVC